MKRRKNGEGTMRKRKDGRWECSIMTGWQADGRKQVKSFYGKTQEEVRRKVLEWKKIHPENRLLQKYVFSEWADIWFELHKDNITPTTQENYQYILRTLKKNFGKKKLTEIKAYDIDVFLRSLRAAGRATSALAQHKGMMYQIMHKAEANDLIQKNPVRFADKIRNHTPRNPKESFTAEEVRILMRDLPCDRTGQSIRLLLGTGMRTQELLALEPRHISVDGSKILIEQAVKLIKGTAAVGTTKSRESVRTIPVPPSLWECARDLRATEKKFIWEGRKPNMPCNPATFRDKFRRVLMSIEGVRLLTPHSCRHTFVSQMQALGVDVPTIQSIVGHAEMSMTEYYLHVQESVKREAVERLDVLCNRE